MASKNEQVNGLISRLSESLNVEIKRWIDINNPILSAKLIKAILAIRNRNGGFVIVGFDNDTLLPDTANAPKEIRTTFHIDRLQGLISRYSSDLFEISIEFPELNGEEYPVVIVPEGVKAPVAAKADLFDNEKNRVIKEGDVYFRTLNANGMPSTAVAKPRDWPEIMEICFNNREADIGRFFRRHFSARESLSFISALGEFGASINTESTATIKGRAVVLLDRGKQRFAEAVAERQLNEHEIEIVNRGTWHVALILDPPHANGVTDRSFLNQLNSSNPNYSGWPLWLATDSFPDKKHRPIVKCKDWETFLLFSEYSLHLDYYLLNPTGEFYLQRKMYEDLTDRLKPGLALDPLITIALVAEAIAVGLAFSASFRSKNGESPNSNLGFLFQWEKLKGRKLYTVGNVGRYLGHQESYNDTVTTFTLVPHDTPPNAVGRFVNEATRDLFATFDGHTVPSHDLEDLCKRFIERKLRIL